MKDIEKVVSSETADHVIEVAGGCLTIGTKAFPDNCVSLNVEETLETLKVVLLYYNQIVEDEK